MLASSGDPILVSDIDLSTPSSEWVKLAERLPTHPVAIGSRAHGAGPRRASARPSTGVLLGKVGNRIIQLFAVPGIRDTQCGFKLFRGDVARELFAARAHRPLRLRRRDPLPRAAPRGIAIAEVPVLWFNSPESKVRVVRDAIQTLWDVLRIRWMHRGDGR